MSISQSLLQTPVRQTFPKRGSISHSNSQRNLQTLSALKLPMGGESPNLQKVSEHLKSKQQNVSFQNRYSDLINDRIFVCPMLTLNYSTCNHHMAPFIRTHSTHLCSSQQSHSRICKTIISLASGKTSSSNMPQLRRIIFSDQAHRLRVVANCLHKEEASEV